MKLDPLTVNDVFPEPTRADVGIIDVIAGVGLLIVKVIALDGPPPGAGLATVIENVPAEVIKFAGIAADICPALTYVVDKDVPFHWIVEFPMKLDPLTVNAVLPVPTRADVGAIDMTVGTGLLTATVIVLDGPPPGPGL